MLNKVPEVTLYFWIIKILATTVGETAADFLNSNDRHRPHRHDADHERVPRRVALFFQFRLRQYVPCVYWLSVVLISVVGTLITDNLVDNYGVEPADDDDRVRDRRSPSSFAVWYCERADALDPLDRHDQARGVLLARGALHVRARHLGRRPRRPRGSPSATGSPRCSSPALIAVDVHRARPLQR